MVLNLYVTPIEPPQCYLSYNWSFIPLLITSKQTYILAHIQKTQSERALQKEQKEKERKEKEEEEKKRLEEEKERAENPEYIESEKKQNGEEKMVFIR